MRRAEVLRLNVVIPVEGAEGMRFALDVLVAANRLFLRRNPTFPELYKAGVRYLRDADAGTQASPDAELWLTAPDALELGGADCKVLAAWRAAELLERSGEQARTELVPPRPGGQVWHVVVRRADGRLEDPSKLLGMEGDA